MNRYTGLLLVLLFAGCSSPSNQFNIKAGFYRVGDPREKAIWDILDKSSVTVTLSGHAGISLPAKTGKGWDNNLSIEQLRKRLESVSCRDQATVFEEKNVTGQSQLQKKVIALLKELGFKTIIIQTAHSAGIIIDEVIRN